jgi:hypothetical protein
MKATGGPARIIYNSADNDWPKTPGALVFEYTWNHTTLRALKVDPSITYLQVRYRYPEHMELIRRCARPSARRFCSISRSCAKTAR